MLSPKDVEALESMVGAAAELPHPFPKKTIADFVRQQLDLRNEGLSYPFVTKDKTEAVGICWLEVSADRKSNCLHFYTGQNFLRKGYATFGVTKLLEFGFNHLRLESITSHAVDAASKRVLEKNGFQFADTATHAVISKKEMMEVRDRPAIAKFHPALRKILEAELAAGNEVAETGGGWPDPDSIFIRLKKPFLTPHQPPPPGVIYTEPNDPHWWKADYSSLSPRHILAC